MRRLIPPLVALTLAAVLVSCSGNDSRSTSAASTPTTAPTTSVGVTAPPTTRAAYHARTLIAGMKRAGQPIGKVVCYSETTDPNNLLGRPGGYIEKCDWADTRYDQPSTGDPSDVVGGSIEVFALPGEAMERAQYLGTFAGQGMLSTGWTFLVPPNSNFVLRVDSDLTSKQATAYRKAMQAEF